MLSVAQDEVRNMHGRLIQAQDTSEGRSIAYGTTDSGRYIFSADINKGRSFQDYQGTRHTIVEKSLY